MVAARSIERKRKDTKYKNQPSPRGRGGASQTKPSGAANPFLQKEEQAEAEEELLHAHEGHCNQKKLLVKKKISSSHSFAF